MSACINPQLARHLPIKDVPFRDLWLPLLTNQAFKALFQLSGRNRPKSQKEVRLKISVGQICQWDENICGSLSIGDACAQSHLPVS